MQPRRVTSWIYPCSRQLSLVIAVCLSAVATVYSADLKVQCQACKDFVQTFWQGHERTAKSNFGGGNTDWEETRLGSYATSETRLVEIMEHSCTFGADKDQCHQFVEHNEEPIEKWYFHLQKLHPNFEKWLCMDNTKVCCPPNTFGPNCKPCPGGVENPCAGRGTCEGNGTREGLGKCKCQRGYAGDLCDRCDNGYELTEQNDTTITCEDMDECEMDPLTCKVGSEYCLNTEGSHKCYKCHPACRGGCSGAGAGRCKSCADGYVQVNGTCIAVPKTLYTGFLQLFQNFDKTIVFCGGGLVTSFFFIRNGEYLKLAFVGVLMAAILSAWKYGDEMREKSHEKVALEEQNQAWSDNKASMEVPLSDQSHQTLPKNERSEL